MTLLGEVREKLVADSAVAALVGDRIFFTVADQGVQAPFAVLTLVSEQPVNTLDGRAADRLMRAAVQVDCYARTHDKARAIADAIDAVLADLSGPELSADRLSASDGYEDGSSLHRAMMEFEVWR